VTEEVVVVIDTVEELNVVPVAVCVWVVTGLVVKTVVTVGAMVVPTGDVVTGVPVVVLRGGSVGVPVRVSLPVTAMVPVTIGVPGELSFEEGGTVCVQPAVRRQNARITNMIAVKEIRSIGSQPRRI
jgi:hypothetical protein